MSVKASSQPVKMTFWIILDSQQSAHRFMIAVLDAYPGLQEKEALVAKKDLSVCHHCHAKEHGTTVRIRESLHFRK